MSSYRCSAEGVPFECPGRFCLGLLCSRQDCACPTDASGGSSVWRGLQRLRTGQPRLCSSLEQLMEQLMEPLQQRRLQTPLFLECRCSPRNHRRQQRDLQRLQLEDLGVQEVQGVLVVLVHPNRQKVDAF